jgi:hypothetical protein
MYKLCFCFFSFLVTQNKLLKKTKEKGGDVGLAECTKDEPGVLGHPEVNNVCITKQANVRLHGE